ncbi:hypothetical protein [Streptomyces sp. I8-5]|uniref:hypothetical protein n=1 Tax=Streptomyces sp. I8-5 TaxID=3104277 RepID=UPI003868C133
MERLNKAWYDLATSSGLIDGNREFLLMLPRGTRTAAEDRRRRTMHVWHRVRLLERWDIMGAGAATFLGIRAGHPGFTMLALDTASGSWPTRTKRVRPCTRCVIPPALQGSCAS